MKNVQQVTVEKIEYKVVKPFLYQHKSQEIGDPLYLTVRAAQHLVLAGFIEEGEAQTAPATTENTKEKAGKK